MRIIIEGTEQEIQNVLRKLANISNVKVEQDYTDIWWAPSPSFTTTTVNKPTSITNVPTPNITYTIN